MNTLNKFPVKAIMLCAAWVSVPAQAADKELLDILLGNGAITQQQHDELMKKEALTKEDAAVITLGNGGGLNFKSGDGKTEVEIGGRLHLDYVDHNYDARIGAPPISGTQIRRGRVEFNGFFDTHWAWAAEFDFAKDATSVKDFKIGYVTDKGSEIYVGNQKQPYSLSLEMSSNDEPFVERGVDNALVAAFTDRAIGLRGETSGEHWFVAGGVFGDTMKTGNQGEEGWGSSFRAVYTPVLEADKVLHLGIRGSYRSINPGTPQLSIRDKTSDFSNLSIVDTHLMTNAESATLYGPEFGVALGPLFVVGEYTDATIKSHLMEPLDFSSWHVAATWTLTGETYAERYRIADGEFKNIRPIRNFDLETGGLGAWEVGARFASIDLNDGDFIAGQEDVGSMALNWYVNRNVRFMFDWTRILDTDGSSIVRLYAPGMDIFTLRSQYAF
jgi:phosphate-selective porin OprO/OprP